jgi:hypothetical protein
MLRMRLHPGFLSFALAAALLVPATAVHAAGVAYIDGGQVWVSSLDGQTKVQLSPTPTDPPGEQWIDVAQGDGGQVIGVRNVPGRQGQFATFAVWQADGTLTDQGPMQNISGYSVNVLPLSLDLTPDGKSMVYGYSLSRYTSQYEFAEGFVTQPVSTRSASTPFSVSGRQWPTLAGKRVVAWESGQISVQNDNEQAPYGQDFTPWVPIGGSFKARRTDVAANGKVAAVELYEPNPGSGDDLQQRIGMFPITGLGGSVSPVDHDCFLPTAGKGKEVSLLQDATKVAYVDDGGVRVAPVTDFAAVVTDCAPTTPVTIAPAGRHPSLGPIDVAALYARRNPVVTVTPPPGTGSTPTTTTPTTSGTAAVPKVTLAATAKALTLGKAAGVPVTVTLAKAGKVTLALTVSSKVLGLKGKAKPVVVATGAGTAKAKGRLTVRLKATAAGRRKLAKLKGRALTLRITFGGRTTTKVVKLR